MGGSLVTMEEDKFFVVVIKFLQRGEKSEGDQKSGDGCNYHMVG